MQSSRCTPLVALSPYSQATLALSNTRPPSSLDVPYLRAQLDRIELTLSTLLDQRLALTARLTEAVALTSPVRLLSAELLSAIFVAATTPGPSDAPSLLSTIMLVCRQWRDICLSTPELWSRISISPNEPDSLEKARRRLLRSKVVPLDIFLDFSPRSSFSAHASQAQHATKQQHITPDHLLKTSLQLLRPTIPRWRTFMLLVPYRPQATAALAICSSPAPLLESLTIQVCNPMLNASSLDWGTSGRSSSLPFRGVTPRLRICSLTSFWCERPDDLMIPTPPMPTVSLDRTPDPSAYSVRDLPYSRMVFPGVGPCLTKLRLVGFWNNFAPDIHETILVLRQCPLLEELYIRNMSDVDSTPEDTYGYTIGEVSLLHLKRLSFYYSGVSRTCAILHRVHMPALGHLELSFLDNITPCLTHLKEIHADAPIHTLRIEASLFNELKLLRLLRYLKHLTRLDLIDLEEDVSANLLKGMSALQQPDEWILPSLTTLNLEGCTSVEWDDLKTLIESRLPSSSASSAARLSSSGDASGFSAASKQAYASYRAPSATNTSSASHYACVHAMTDTPHQNHAHLSSTTSQSYASQTSHQSSSSQSFTIPQTAHRPQKITKLDLTRCSQIPRERIQWLKMYVDQVVVREDTGR